MLYNCSQQNLKRQLKNLLNEEFIKNCMKNLTESKETQNIIVEGQSYKMQQLENNIWSQI